MAQFLDSMHMMNQTTVKPWKTTPVPVHTVFLSINLLYKIHRLVYEKLFCYIMQIIFLHSAFALQNFPNKIVPWLYNVDAGILFTAVDGHSTVTDVCTLRPICWKNDQCILCGFKYSDRTSGKMWIPSKMLLFCGLKGMRVMWESLFEIHLFHV